MPLFPRLKANVMKPAALAVLALGLSTASHAQVGLIMAATRLGTSAVLLATADHQYMVKGPGSYQLTSADWQPGTLQLTNTGLTVGKGKTAQPFALDKLQQVVVRTDTFAVVHNARVSGTASAVAAPLLGRRVWRVPQVEQFEFHSAGGVLPLLRFPDGRAVVLPSKPKDFRAAMLKLVGDHPKLGAQLQTNELEPMYLRSILATYLQWKPAGFDPTALLAEQPAAK